ncbi:CLUMA_CG013786, isoform A [Clunio marinus]|uniref:CLUMA_CG013786, isoform A n=1 Tax=Clunio marinus TaxID=568069 RepID=A0A1J1IJU9_9DIPT|nr:CLUMA_CG013786, isoform A [Clunio marinus]
MIQKSKQDITFLSTIVRRKTPQKASCEFQPSSGKIKRLIEVYMNIAIIVQVIALNVMESNLVLRSIVLAFREVAELSFLLREKNEKIVTKKRCVGMCHIWQMKNTMEVIMKLSSSKLTSKVLQNQIYQ